MASLSRTGRPKLSAMRVAWAASGQTSRTISMVVPRRSGTTRALVRGARAVLVMVKSFSGFAVGFGPALPVLPSGAVAQRRRDEGRFKVRAPPGEQGPVADKRGPRLLGPAPDAAEPCRDRRS